MRSAYTQKKQLGRSAAARVCIKAVLLVGGLLWSSVGAQEFEAAKEPLIGFYSCMNAGEMHVAVISDAEGDADFHLDRESLELSWSVQWNDLGSEVTGIHIHAPGRPGEKAAVALDLGTNLTHDSASGSSVLPSGLLSHLLTGRAYVNIHTRRHPDGEIRGKVERLHPLRGKIECPDKQ